MALKIIKPGIYASVQDMGRTGHRRYGVPVSGCMDRHAAAMANLLVGNTESAAVIEFLLHGATMEAGHHMLLAFSGGGSIPQVNGVDVLVGRAVLVRAGSVIHLRYHDKACRMYMAMAGGVDVPEVMGSRSSYDPVGAAYRLEAGMRLNVGLCSDVSLRIMNDLRSLQRTVAGWGAVEWLEHELSEWVRVLRGPEWKHLPYRELMAATYTVGDRSDRMGMMLESREQRAGSGEQGAGMEMLSTGVCVGTVQMLPSGSPMVLMADAQTTGGYPRWAQVITADLWLLAQARPGDKIRFREVSLQVAQELCRNRREELDRLARSIRTKFAR